MTFSSGIDNGLIPSLIQLVTKAPALVTWGRLLRLRPVPECTQISRATQTPAAGHITHKLHWLPTNMESDS